MNKIYGIVCFLSIAQTDGAVYKLSVNFIRAYAVDNGV